MASTPVPAKANPLSPDDWIRAAFTRLASEGVEAVRVEVLARDLGVSKGSFYWHFKDREDLLEKMLARWEHEEAAWLESAIVDEPNAAARWARFVERSASPERTAAAMGLRTEAALRDWARHDARVAARIAQVEQRRASFIASVLREIGFTPGAAESWSEIAMLASLGWLDRASRTSAPESGAGAKAARTLSELLSDLILAASRAH